MMSRLDLARSMTIEDYRLVLMQREAAGVPSRRSGIWPMA